MEGEAILREVARRMERSSRMYLIIRAAGVVARTGLREAVEQRMEIIVVEAGTLLSIPLSRINKASRSWIILIQGREW